MWTVLYVSLNKEQGRLIDQTRAAIAHNDHSSLSWQRQLHAGWSSGITREYRGIRDMKYTSWSSKLLCTV